jgi:hypothetical protein
MLAAPNDPHAPPTTLESKEISSVLQTTKEKTMKTIRLTLSSLVAVLLVLLAKFNAVFASPPTRETYEVKVMM